MKILLLRPDHIGDMLLTTPFLSFLRSSFPDAEITILCGSWTSSILENNPNYDKLIECDFPWLARGGAVSKRKFFDTINGLRHKKFDIVINLRKAAKTAAVAWFMRGGRTWGFDVGKSAWAHSERIHYRTDKHIADLYGEFVTEMGGKYDCDSAKLELFFSDDERNEFSSNFQLQDDFIVCAPGAGYPEKLWQPEKWSELASQLIEESGRKIHFIGSQDEAEEIERIIGSVDGVVENYAGKMSIRETAQMIEKAKLVVGLDSAAMHISSAVQTPVVALFGPTNPVHWGPYDNGLNNQVISKVETFSEGRGSTNVSGGMELISVEDVLQAFRKRSPDPA